MKFLRVRNWERYQHYKDRNPTWIKLYPVLLEKWEYTTLPDASKSHLQGIFMLAAKRGNCLPADAAYLGQQIAATDPINLELLMEPGRALLEYCDEGGQAMTVVEAAPPPAPVLLSSRPGSGTEVLAGAEHNRTELIASRSGSAPVLETANKRNRDAESREQKPTPLPPPSGAGADPPTKAQAAATADRLAVRAKELLGKPVTARQVRLWRGDLRRGITEAEILAPIEAEATAAAEKRRDDEAWKAGIEAANAWIRSRGGSELVVRGISEWIARNAEPEENEAKALRRWLEDPELPDLVRGSLTDALGPPTVYQMLERAKNVRQRPPSIEARSA